MAVMPSDDFASRISAAARSCPDVVSGQVFRSPADAFADLARSGAGLGVDEWDVYGESGPVARLEAELVERPQPPAPARRRRPASAARPGNEPADPRLRGPAAPHLRAVPGRLGAVLVELPLRDAGCLLPTWDDLAGLSQEARDRGVALHFDAARVWASQPSFGRPRWRKRQGGTIYHLTAEAVSALVGVRDQPGSGPGAREASRPRWRRWSARRSRRAPRRFPRPTPPRAAARRPAGRPRGRARSRAPACG